MHDRGLYLQPDERPWPKWHLHVDKDCPICGESDCWRFSHIHLVVTRGLQHLHNLLQFTGDALFSRRPGKTVLHTECDVQYKDRRELEVTCQSRRLVDPNMNNGLSGYFCSSWAAANDGTDANRCSR